MGRKKLGLLGSLVLILGVHGTPGVLVLRVGIELMQQLYHCRTSFDGGQRREVCRRGLLIKTSAALLTGVGLKGGSIASTGIVTPVE